MKDIEVYYSGGTYGWLPKPKNIPWNELLQLTLNDVPRRRRRKAKKEID